MASIYNDPMVDALTNMDAFDIGELINVVNQKKTRLGLPPVSMPQQPVSMPQQLNPTAPPVFGDRTGVNDPFRAASALNQVTNIPLGSVNGQAQQVDLTQLPGFYTPQQRRDMPSPQPTSMTQSFERTAPRVVDTSYDVPFNPGTMVPRSAPNYPQVSQGSVNGQAQQIDLRNLPGYYTPQELYDMRSNQPSYRQSFEANIPFVPDTQYDPTEPINYGQQFRTFNR